MNTEHRVNALRLLFCIGLLSTSVAARGASYTYTFIAGTPTVTSSTTETIPLLLHEVTPNGVSQVNSDGGLYSFGLTASVTAGMGTIAGLTRNSAFDSIVTNGPNASTTSFPTAQAKLYAEQASSSNGVMVDSSGNAMLATLTLSNFGSATTLSFADINPTGSQTVDYNGTGVDPTTTTSTTFYTPEPAAMLAGFTFTFVLSRRHRATL